jgi:hypothetical protein
MKLGMSSAEIEAAIKAHDPTFTIGIAKVATGRFLGIDKFVQFVIAKRQIPNAFPETIVVGFTMTQPGRAFYIGRSTHFAPGQQSLIDNTLQQLRDKYGQESPNNSMSGFYWLFDNAGKRPVKKLTWSCNPGLSFRPSAASNCTSNLAHHRTMPIWSRAYPSSSLEI